MRSAGHALPIATQNLLAASWRITIAPHIDIDVATTGPASTIRVNVDSGTSVAPLSPSLTIDVHVYVTALLRSRAVATRALLARAHSRAAVLTTLLCRRTATLGGAVPTAGAIFAAVFRLASARSRRLTALLHFQCNAILTDGSSDGKAQPLGGCSSRGRAPTQRH